MSLSSVSSFAPFSRSSFGAARALVPNGTELRRDRQYQRNNEVVSYANAFRSLRLKAESQNEAEGTQSAASIKFSSRARSVEYEDGTVRNQSSAKLRFRYSFESEDGTQITLKASANLSFSQQASADGSDASLKVKARFYVGVIQDQVASGAEGLTANAELPESVQAVVAQALGLFQTVSDTLSESATSGDSIDGDALIQGLVDAFNQFAGSVLQPFLGNSSNGEAAAVGSNGPAAPATPTPAAIETLPVPPAPSPAPLPPPAPDAPSASEVDPSDAVTTSDEDSAPANEVPVESSTETSTTPSNSNADAASSTVAPIDNGPESEDNEAATTKPTDVNAANVASLRSSAEASLYRIRLSVVQSLTQLTRSFDGETSETTRTSLFASAKIDFRSKTYSPINVSAPLIGTSVDLDG